VAFTNPRRLQAEPFVTLPGARTRSRASRACVILRPTLWRRTLAWRGGRTFGKRTAGVRSGADRAEEMTVAYADSKRSRLESGRKGRGKQRLRWTPSFRTCGRKDGVEPRAVTSGNARCLAHVLELDGEIITKATPDVGYLHRGDEKIAENMTYTQFIPYTDRLDYLAPLANNVAYALAVEKLMGIDVNLPPRCQFIPCDLLRVGAISSQPAGIGSFAMDCGAMTVFLHTFTEREKVYNLCESLTGRGSRRTTPGLGGLARDLPPGWAAAVP